ncbi:2-oxoglutarate dehydrogenase complex dihydrolipoyllysine-residue succinyltransferase [Cytobacillus sp. IB215316]|uniref:2-oxoglutarate dehydrogenase complex dihydrolipoyllysine-residue succinyltransferase n=1 Tax=Cytobacillus sp. IB215316 TaxID=3097354 RepID=UPI002A0C3559|nr:2-oxoglutarate dehydrogenase complex dihydrolipoyllysine-residue succinyltransferase [Cytobacillus sp. IB215316]MDX8360423.1 2-oxoglutarate dehydrogenase complex dihydrolipoyllysine-residue succinyltransferase [Cytobacillus sp. IB215316]
MKEIKVPELAESVTEGTISEWFKHKGDSISKGEAIVELETDKINIEIYAEYDGVLEDILAEPGEVVFVDQVIAKVNDKREVLTSNESFSNVATEETVHDDQPKIDVREGEQTNKMSSQNERPIATPAARKKARELGIDLKKVDSSDLLGRIRPENVINYATSIQEKQDKSTITDNAQPPFTDLTQPKQIERIPMSRRRQTIAHHLVQAQQQAAMLTTFNEVDMTAIINLRNRKKQRFEEKYDVRLGYMSFFTKAVVGALKAFPMLNAEIQDNEIILKRYYDIGIAVSAEEGLVVPVLRDANQLSFADIEKGIRNLASKAREKKLSLQDLQGGTFTITNGGVFGSLFSTPILNAPQVGILGMHKIQKKPIVIDEDDTIAVRPMMYIALSYDHRIIDGREAVQFLVHVKELVEDPESLLLDG